MPLCFSLPSIHTFRDIELKIHIEKLPYPYLANKFENYGLKNNIFLFFNLHIEFIDLLNMKNMA